MKNIYVNKDCTVTINGVKSPYKKGVQKVNDDHANILISAGKAEEVKKETPATPNSNSAGQ